MSCLLNDITIQEELVMSNLCKNSIMILNTSIIRISSINSDTDDEVILPIIDIQIAIELYIKYYICTQYGFDEILTTKYKSLRNNNPLQYLQELELLNIKTLGFNELKAFLERKKDKFSYVIKEGVTPFFWIEYDYLEGTFEKFQNIRNGFVHLGVELSESDKRWIKTEFFSVVILFFSMLFRETDATVSKIYSKSREYKFQIYQTPVDILKNYLSKEAFDALLQNKAYEDTIIDMAIDVSKHGKCFKCDECGKNALAIDMEFTDGVTKCFYCGNIFKVGYADCNNCGSQDTVIYDNLNLIVNRNIMPAYCFECQEHIKIYVCPICEKSYTYDEYSPIKNFKFNCCKENFIDRIW